MMVFIFVLDEANSRAQMNTIKNDNDGSAECEFVRTDPKTAIDM